MPEERITLAYSTWRSVRLPVRVVCELLGQDGQAVQRRAQLVRHVRDELRLVPGRGGELLRLLLDEPLRLLDLLVLRLDLAVLLGQERGLLGEILVGLRQLLLARLELLGLRLRLLEEPLRHRRGVDRVQHEADALRQLVQECLVGRAEGRERRQLDHGQHRSLERNREHDDVQRRRLAEARVDLDVVGRNVGQQDPLLLQGALADQSLADTEMVRDVLALLEAVPGLELEDGPPPSCRSVSA